jgi:hypothetical protein
VVHGARSRTLHADGEKWPPDDGNEVQGRKALTFMGLFQSDEGFYGNPIRSPFSATEQLDGSGQSSPSLSGPTAPTPDSSYFASQEKARTEGPPEQGEAVG